jgi:hypothetical protein
VVIKTNYMPYYKLELDLRTEAETQQLLQRLSDSLSLPIEPTQVWRTNRTAPFLQLIGTDIYIRHLRDVSDMERNQWIDIANNILFNIESDGIIVTIPNKVGSLTFKFFH